MKKIYKLLLSICTVLILVIASFFIYININTEPIKDLSYIEAGLKSLGPEAVKVAGVKLYTQPDPYSCGVTTISVMSSFCENKDLPPQTLIDKYKLPGGMKIDEFKDLLSKELPEYTVTYQHPQDDFELIKTIYEQLKDGVPVPVFFGAENPYNKPNYDFHASVITGIDPVKQLVDIVNVYGYEEQISLIEFLNRMSYRGTENYPLVQRAVLKLGLMDKNSVFLLTKK